MSRQNRKSLSERVATAAEAALAADRQVSPIDVLCHIGWLPPSAVAAWRKGREGCLEEAMQVAPDRVAEALRLLREWAAKRRLVPSETEYISRTTTRRTLRFSASGDADVETAYRTHWLSPSLTQAERERMTEKASRPPELVVIQPLRGKWTCHRCEREGGRDLLMMDGGGSACLDCVGLGDLEFLGAGNAALTRRTKAKSERFAVVVRFARARGRYERQGLLVEPNLAEAMRELGIADDWA